MENQNSETTITFEWHSLLRDVIHNAWLIVLAGLIAWMGIYVGTRSVYSPTYTSSAVLAVRAKVGTADTFSNLSTSSDMAEIFTRVFTQPTMKAYAAEELGQPSFQGSVSASVMGKTNLLKLSVTTDSPERSYRELKAILKVYPEIADNIFADAVLDVLESPSVPMGPSKSLTRSKEGVLIILAMMLEGGAIVLISLLRGTVKTEKAFEQMVDAKLLGSVSHTRKAVTTQESLKGKKRSILINDPRTELRFCEDYYKIANRLAFLQKQNGSKVYAVTSVAENEGKSTAAVNLALALEERGYRVALLDLDVRKPAIYKMLDKQQEITSELSDVLSGKIPVNQQKLYRYRKTGLVLALNKTSHTDTTRWISGELTRSYIEAMKNRMDFVLIDTSPVSVSADAVTLAGIADETILLVRTDVVAAEDINDAVFSVQNSGGRLAGCILNDVYRPFTFFGQMGAHESGYHGYHGYGNGYGKYGRYGENFSEEEFPVKLPDDLIQK